VTGVDLATQRKLTLAFIDQIPATIVFIPRSKEKAPSGGFVWKDGLPRDPQVVTFIETSAQGGWPRPVLTLDGVERVAEMQIVAAWDATIAVHDVFTHQGKEWEVIGVFYDNGYEARALVSGRG
jgi:hypothetical protein